ncbi:hypothetical protein LDENG_00075090 [Lucifuga dentata]|nr:hypothetical protein LDENG_00075090 [Lucifuga dentata]
MPRPAAPSHTGSLCSGLFSASALVVSCSAPNLRDYVRTHHHYHRKPPLSPGSLPCQISMFGTFLGFTQLPVLCHHERVSSLSSSSSFDRQTETVSRSGYALN